MKVTVRREGASLLGGIAITEDGFAGVLVGRREDGKLRCLGTVEFGCSARRARER